MTTENIPESNGEEIFLDNYHFIIEAVTNTKIETVKLIVLEEKEEENNSEAKD